MLRVILAFVVLLMACVLLAPATVNNILHPGVPKELRPPASRLIFVPVIVIFLFGTFMFDSIMPLVADKTVLSAGQLQHRLSSIAGLFFLLFGAFACLWPSRFMRMCSPRLRPIDERSIDEREMNALARVARGFGIIFLLGSAFLLRGWFR
jgi:hypothetical protein